MTKLLVAIFAFTAISATAAMAQPAYTSDEGGPPASYPPCTHPHEDRCMQGPGMEMHHHHHHGH
ncbi:MAG TPA: hypothetical protein VKU90_07765 [Caulobacteraceae bacterium]|nr:hypothetical protein [Caulobacteraceae bacterium]